jgi:tetratricopeptide (TPR) repeat protein
MAMNEADQIMKHFETGKALRKRSLYHAACIQFQKASEIAPASADLLVEWGQALFDKGDLPGAIKKYQKASELDSKRSDAFVLWGKALYDSGKYNESEGKYEKALEVAPQDITALSGLANALCAQKEWKRAVEVYEKVIEGDPTSYVWEQLATALEKLEPDENSRIAKALESRLTSDARYAIALTWWADALANQAKYDEAIERYRNASSVDPAYRPAYIGCGFALQQQGKHVEALNCYLKAIEYDPSTFWSFAEIESAIANLNKEESVAASKRLNEILRSDPKHAAFFCNWGDYNAAREHYAEAIAHYQEALRFDPKHVDAFSGWGDALAAQQKFDEAIDQYGKAILINPSATSAYLKWAKVLSSKGQYTEAAERYQKAIEIDLAPIEFPELLKLLDNLDPKRKAQTRQTLESALARHASPKEYLRWGKAFDDEKRYMEAIPQYEKALQLDEKDQAAWKQIGQAQANLKNDSKAIESYQKITELDPYDRSNYIYWGYALHSQSKFAEAIKQYKKALELNPDDASTHTSLGWALHEQQKYNEAIEQYHKATEITPAYTLAWRNWGVALAAQKSFDEAIEQYKKAIDLDPENVDLYLDWGNALEEQGRRAEAIKVCEKAIQINQDFAYAYHNIAYYLWAQGDYEAGRKAWESACEVYERTKRQDGNKDNASFFHYYGWVLYEHMGNLEKSQQVLKEGLTIDPDHAGILGSLVSLYLERHEESNDGGGPGIYWKARDYFMKGERVLKAQLERKEDSSTLVQLGELYLEMREYDEAKGYFEKAHTKDPESSTPYVGLGVICSRKEDFRQAAQYFESARRCNLNNLNIWSNLAEAYLKLDQEKLKQIEKSEAEYRKILNIAPQNIDSLIGLGEVYTAMAKVGEKDKDFYETAIKYFSQAIQLADAGKGSKRLKKKDLAAVHYSQGYAKVQYYEASKPFGNESLLIEALHDFGWCCVLDPSHHKGERAKKKLEKQLNGSSPQKFFGRVAPWVVMIPSLFVFVISQTSYFLGIPNPKNGFAEASYISLTFGALLFFVIGLFLPQIQKLKGPGIEIEKVAGTQIGTSGSLGISK